MAVDSRPPRLAVLIDGDNASPGVAKEMFEEIARIGEATVRRIYGNFAGSVSKGWSEQISRYAIIPQQQFANTAGKNASDIALVIDAMDLLHGGRLDGFCIVSSDGDFTRLAARIREQGLDVYGIGERKTPDSFRLACRKFIDTDGLRTRQAHTEKEPPSAPHPPSKAIPLLTRAIGQLESEDGWVHLGVIGNQLANLMSEFDPRNYGSARLSDLVRKTGAFDMARDDTGHIKVRPRPSRNAA
jgi:hypothetical protein